MCQWMAFVERPNCSSTSAHSSVDQPWPAVLGLMQASHEARGDSLGFHFVDHVLGQAPETALRLFLERNQHLLDEAARARLDVTRPFRELERGFLDCVNDCACVHRADTLT